MPAESPQPRAGHDVPRGLVLAAGWTWRLLVVATGAFVLGWVFLRLSIITIPVFIALIVAAALWPLTAALRRVGFPHALAAFVTLALVGGAVIGLGFLIGPSLVDRFGELTDRIEEGARELPDALGGLGLGIDEQDVEEAIDGAVDALRDNARMIGFGVFQAVLVAANIAAGFVLGLVVLFFFLKDGPFLWRTLLKAVPEANRGEVDRAGQAAFDDMSHYVRAQALVALIDAVGIGLAVYLVGVPLVIPIAVLTFVLAFIPFIGAIISGFVAVMVALAFGGLTDALIVLGAVIAVQQLEGNVLQPVIVGRSVRLHPVVVLVAVGVGGSLAGIAGAIVAVPLAAAIHGAARSLADEDEPQLAPEGESSEGSAEGGEDRAAPSRPRVHPPTATAPGRRSAG